MADKCENPTCQNPSGNGYCCQKCWDELPHHIKYEVSQWDRNRRTGELYPTAGEITWFDTACRDHWNTQGAS